MTASQPVGVHLVGSVPLTDTHAVFSLIGQKLGQHVCRIPDGETGARKDWVTGQYLTVFSRMPAFEREAVEGGGPYKARPRLRLRPGLTADDIAFPPLGYASAAIASYAELKRLRAAGVIPSGVRFMVCLPTPLAPVETSFVPESRPIVARAYGAKMMSEIGEIVAAIPPGELAIQWDVAVEFAIIEGVMPSHYAHPEEDCVRHLVSIGNRVPREVELGYHLCYGDFGHKHFKEPTDTAIMVRVINAVAAGLERSLEFVHLPVPRDRTDDAYYAPLAGLKLSARTELYLGLVHLTDGAAGTHERIRTARRFVSKFGIGTECGMGRRPAESIPALLDIHAETAHPLAR